MINRPLFTSETIRLTALDAKEDAPTVAAWTQDSRNIPLSYDAPPRPMSAAQAEKMLNELLKETDEKRNSFWFAVRTLDESELLGITGLDWADWSNGAARMRLNMKNLAEYARPSAEETVTLMLHYIFRELQMHRVGLPVPAYNEGLVGLLHKLGFVEEARHHEAVFRFGRRWDIVHFGMLVADWANCEQLDEGTADDADQRSDDIYRGEKVYLAAIEPEKDAELLATWQRDSEYARLLDSDPVRLWSAGQIKEWLEKQQKEDKFEDIEFMIRTLEGDKPIGTVGLDDISFHNGNSWVAIGIGERAYWGKGFGTDVLRILARYAFEELGLHRLSLTVFAYNTRAIRSYEKVGFKVEGHATEVVHREGKRWDLVYMGLLREDWLNQASPRHISS